MSVSELMSAWRRANEAEPAADERQALSGARLNKETILDKFCSVITFVL